MKEAEDGEEAAGGYRARARARAWGLGAAVFAALAGLEALRPPLLLVGPATVDVVHGARRPVRALPRPPTRPPRAPPAPPTPDRPRTRTPPAQPGGVSAGTAAVGPLGGGGGSVRGRP